MMSLKVWFLLVSSSTILMFVTLFFLFPSSTNKHMTDVDVTPPSPNACSYLPALLNGSPTFVTSNISFASSSSVMFPATSAASSILKTASTRSPLWLWGQACLVGGAWRSGRSMPHRLTKHEPNDGKQFFYRRMECLTKAVVLCCVTFPRVTAEPPNAKTNSHTGYTF